MRNPIKMWKARRKEGLLENTVMLFLMQFTTILLGIVTTSLQYRRLGTGNVDIIALAITIMTFVQLFMDFGFIQSATGKIAENRDDRAFVSKVFTCVTVIKLMFAMLSVAFVAILLAVRTAQGRVQGLVEIGTYWLYLLSTVTNSLMGEYLYKGLEKMAAITYRAVAIKLFAVLMIFLFMREPDHYYMVPLFTAIGNTVALVFIHWHIFTKLKIRFVPIKRKEIGAELKSSAHFFISRAATTVYNQLNVLILDSTSATTAGSGVGYYKTGNSYIDSAKNGVVSPVVDSLYPHLMRTRNFSLIKKTLKYGLPILIAGCTAVYILAPFICDILVEPENSAGITTVLRGLMPTVVIALPSYLLGFPTLSPMGLSKQVNNSTIFGTAVQLCLLVIAAVTGNINLATLCLFTCITESAVLLYRIVVVYRNRHLMRMPDENKE